MPNLSAWISTSSNRLNNGLAASRAADAWKRISDKPTSITIVRKGVNQDAQTVRVEYDSYASEQRDNANSGRMTCTVFGVRDHATIDDTDIRRGDRFVLTSSVYGNAEFEVMGVIQQTGEIQAVCELLT